MTNNLLCDMTITIKCKGITIPEKSFIYGYLNRMVDNEYLNWNAVEYTTDKIKTYEA